MKCDKCEVEFPVDGDCVKCSVCDKRYHYDCSVRESKWRNLSAELKSKWACVLCKGSSVLSQKSSASSSLTEMDGTAASEDDVSTKTLLLRMNSRLDMLDEVKKSVDTMSHSLAFLSDKYDDILNELKDFKKSSDTLKGEVEKLKTTCSEKDKALSLLTRRFNALEQYGRGVNLEVHGLTMEYRDELSEVVVKRVAQVIGMPYNPWEIQAAHRLPSKDDRPPILLIQFVSKATKMRWLLAGRKRKLYSKNVVDSGEDRVYFNENLTPFYGKLFQETRKLAREKKYEAVWVLNGTIRVKKNKDDRQTLIISDFEDLSKLV